MKKHAYLIIAHNEPLVFQLLVNSIDDIRNDIFVLIDKKVDINQFKKITVKYSKLYWSDRISVYWGDLSLIEAELLLLELAHNTGIYSYYHILSGVDLPLKSQDYIHNKLSNSNYEFVGFTNDYDAAKDRVLYFHFFVKYFKSKNKLIRGCAKVFHKILIICQKILHIQRKINLNNDMSKTSLSAYVIRKGCNWCSITSGFVNYLLQYKDKILRQFKWTFCSDEIFIQTMLWNSPYRDSINQYNMNDENLMCMREIDWVRGGPYTWRYIDLEYLKHSDRFFARKFSSLDKDFLTVMATINSNCQ